MSAESVFPELTDALEADDNSAVAELVTSLQPADLADYLAERSDATLASELLGHLTLSDRAQAFGYLSEELQAAVAGQLSATALARLMGRMDADERADLFKSMDEERQELVLRQMAMDEREDLRRLASYEEGTAGALLTSDYVAIPQGLTVAEALRRVRETAPDAESIYQVYVLDQTQRLAGTISLRELILALPGDPVDELMATDLVSVTVDTLQEEVARLVSRYDLLTLPVVDSEGVLVGMITHDDAMDVAAEEATEDMHKAATIGKLETGVAQARKRDLYRKRVVWLILLVFANIFSGLGIALYEEVIAEHVVLVFFLPLLVASGGNAGSQASTLMVRGLATGDVRAADWGRMLGRELLVSGALGITMALAVAAIGLYRGGPALAVIVALSMVLIVLLGSLIGMSLPFLLDRLRWDPATASTPLVTSIADIVGILAYFAIAVQVLTVLG